MTGLAAGIVSRIDAATPNVPERGVPEDFERPTCPYCDRELGTAPWHGGLAWKCVAHGTFPASEFDANILDAIQETVEETGGPGIGTAIIAVLVALPFILYDIVASVLTNRGEAE